MNYLRYSKRSNLRDSDILDILRLGESKSDTFISKAYNIHRKTAYDIRKRNIWSHVPAPVSLKGNSKYHVYPDGRIWSTASNRFIKPQVRKNGEMFVCLDNKGTTKTVSVSELVAKSFVLPKNSRKRKINISYKDNNPSDPHFINIQVK